MLGGHSTLNTVLLGEVLSKYRIPPHFAYHSCWRGDRTVLLAAEKSMHSARIARARVSVYFRKFSLAWRARGARARIGQFTLPLRRGDC